MEDKNTVTYFLFNDRKGTLRCSFILSCSLTFFEFYSCFTYILPLLYPKYGTILFCLSPFSFSNHPYFIATPPPIRLHFALLHLNILPYIKKNFSISILSLPISSTAPIFSPFISVPFPFQITSIFSPLFPFSFSTKNLFLHPLNPFAPKAWQLYRAITMILPHKSSAIISKKHCY